MNNKMVITGKMGGYKPSLKQRESNLELFRIITMLLIVAHHFVVNSGLLEPIYDNPTSKTSLFLLLFGAWGKTGINCFVLITGYFMCKSKITAKKFSKLFCEWMFYRIVIFSVFVISGYQAFTLKSAMLTLVPISKIGDNFTSCFIIFWLTIPFLNILLNNMSEKQHVRLLLLCSFTYILLGTIHSVIMNYVTWFIVLYFISSYIRLYPKKCFNNTLLWGVLTFISFAVSAISVVCCAFLGLGKVFHIYDVYYFVADSNTLLAVTTGVCSFMFFKNIRIKYSKVINTIAASTFGVLLIHANSDTMRQWLWKDTLNNVGHYSDSLMPLYAFCCVIGVFAVCVVIDLLRIQFIEKLFFKFWVNHWDTFSIWFSEKEKGFFNKLHVN